MENSNNGCCWTKRYVPIFLDCFSSTDCNICLPYIFTSFSYGATHTYAAGLQNNSSTAITEAGSANGAHVYIGLMQTRATCSLGELCILILNLISRMLLNLD